MPPGPAEQGEQARERATMVRDQLVTRGISDPLVLQAMTEVPREAFVDPGMAGRAYHDTPLPIGHGQTISQPFIVALMAQMAELSPGDRVLEIGAGCGYAAAVYGRITGQVWAVERLPALAARARTALDRSGVGKVAVRCGDGSLGWPQEAPFDAILVAAGSPCMPQSLIRQLADGGRLVAPVGPDAAQQLVRTRRLPDGSLEEDRHPAVRFVPLIGAEGWPDMSGGADDEG
ncbi:protein-L-isoaspartate(D-aspartate) O-methyltransferase [Marinibaculum pumilum]|uniref:Protein-L-isoaspartate O-methyltransferase n=1 Tax=Marinibaculum pumilum TaxID=1766165 RepID=A0ABV7KVX8_9PROT